MKSKQILLCLSLVIFLALTISVNAANINFWNITTAWFNDTGDLNLSGKIFCENCIDSEDIEDGIIEVIDMSSSFNNTFRKTDNETYSNINVTGQLNVTGLLNASSSAEIGIVIVNDTGIFWPTGRYIIDNGTGIVVQG